MVNGGCKFFNINYALFKNGGSATASSNSDTANSILDISIYTQWISNASNDLTTETITISLGNDYAIDRLILADFNFKEFTIKYNNGSSFVDFSNVIGVNGATSAIISETAYSYDSAYYEFDEVTTDEIQIMVTKTQVADAQKELTTFIATKEIGTFEGFPRIRPDAQRNEQKSLVLSKKYIVQKTYETNRIKMTFKTHPFQNDLDIVENIFDREEPFLVYPCGGRIGANYFKVDMKAWGLKDIFNMQLVGRIKNEFEKGVYLLGFNKSLTFEEHV